jgi:hypothetical protein
MSDIEKKYRLNDSKVFCMAPWVSINNNPNGDILPCCVARDGTFGNLYKDDIETIWNNEKYKDFRKGMLEDKKSSHCERCYREEEWGSNSNYRKYWNELYHSKYDELVPQTNPDGSLSTMNLYRWDFRFNNLCNLACIGCSPDYSSSWVELNKRMWPNSSKESKIYSSRENKEKFIETIKTQAKVVDNIYFAGGEPLMHSEHYEIMEELDKLGKLDKVDFMYSTNLSNLHYKNHYIVNYWNKMKKCKVLVSLDEVDPERLYYIRYPSDQKTIIDNIKIINKSLSGVEKTWSITPTWSLLNTHRMKEIVEFFYINKLLPYSFYTSISWETDMHNIIMMYPRHLSISISTPEWKEYLHMKLNEFEEWYSDVLIPLKTHSVRPFALKILKDNMNKFRNALNEENNEKNFKQWYERMDKSRETNFYKTFPELSWHLNQLN